MDLISHDTWQRLRAVSRRHGQTVDAYLDAVLATAASPAAAPGVTDCREPGDDRHPDAVAMTLSRAFTPGMPPRPGQAHVLVIHQAPPNLLGGFYERSAGVASQYVGLLPLGAASQNLRRSPRRGLMEAGARIFVGYRQIRGVCTILGALPYGGLRPGTCRRNAVLIGQTAGWRPLPAPHLIETGVSELVPGALVVSPTGGDPNSFLTYTAAIRSLIAEQLAQVLTKLA